MLNPLNFLSKILKTGNQKELNKIDKIVKEISTLEKDISSLNDEEFPKKTIELKDKIKQGIGFR